MTDTMTAPRSVRGAAPSNPTLRELEVLWAVVETGDELAAGQRLGVTLQTISNHMTNLYAKIGARSRLHAVLLLWPVLGDLYRLPGGRRRPDGRSGRERRA